MSDELFICPHCGFAAEGLTDRKRCPRCGKSNNPPLPIAVKSGGAALVIVAIAIAVYSKLAVECVTFTDSCNCSVTCLPERDEPRFTCARFCGTYSRPAGECKSEWGVCQFVGDSPPAKTHTPKVVF